MKEKKLEFGDNQVIGFWNGYAIVHNNDDEKLYCFESPEIKDLIGTSVEMDLLENLPDVHEKEMKEFYDGMGEKYGLC